MSKETFAGGGYKIGRQRTQNGKLVSLNSLPTLPWHRFDEVHPRTQDTLFCQVPATDIFGIFLRPAVLTDADQATYPAETTEGNNLAP